VEIPNGEARSSRELLERAFQEASIEYPGPLPPLLAVMALPGLSTLPLRRAAAETVRAVLPAGSRAILCDDMEPLLAGGLEGEAGFLLNSGKEAGVGSVDEHGVFSRVDEPPEPLGQEGSGLWLGTRTLQLAARLLEGRLPESSRLVAALTQHFQRRSLHEVWDGVMAEAPDAATILALAGRTIALAEFPDPEPACRALVVRAARRLSDLLGQARADAPSAARATWHGSTATGALLDEVVRQTPDLDWQPPRRGGLDGCLYMARAFGEAGLGEGECRVEDAGPGLWLAMRARKEALIPLGQGTPTQP
jgi:N-acetylglucosamine kinase-like BadF-type ATPase